MPVMKVLEKIKTGYRQLFPETVGTAVITATGNAQTDITNLMNDVSKLKEAYYAPINNLIGTYPISGWVDWVDIDP